MNPKDIQNELNSKKGLFVQQIITESVKHTIITAEKTKDPNYAGQIAKAAQELSSENTNIPDIIIASQVVDEPQVKILYPNLTNRVFYFGAPIQLIFETKNVKIPYSCYVFANASGRKIDLFVDQNIRFDKHTIPNILKNRQLLPGRYDIFVVLYDNNKGNRKRLTDSKGNPVVDSTQRIMGIEIRAPISTGKIDTTNKIPEEKKEEKHIEEEKKEEHGIRKLLKPHINPIISIINKNDFNKTFAGNDLVPLVFEVKNINRYRTSIFLQKDPNNAIELDTQTYNQPIIKLNIPIRDLIRKKVSSLNLSEYKKLVVLLRDEYGNQLSGTKLIDSVDIKIDPLMLTTGGPAPLATRNPGVEINLPDDMYNDQPQKIVFTVKNIDDVSGKIDYDYEIKIGSPFGGTPIMQSSGKNITVTPYTDPNIDLSKVKVYYTSGSNGPEPLAKRIFINVTDNFTNRKITAYKDVRIWEKKGTIF